MGQPTLLAPGPVAVATFLPVTDFLGSGLPSGGGRASPGLLRLPEVRLTHRAGAQEVSASPKVFIKAPAQELHPG